MFGLGKGTFVQPKGASPASKLHSILSLCKNADFAEVEALRRLPSDAWQAGVREAKDTWRGFTRSFSGCECQQMCGARRHLPLKIEIHGLSAVPIPGSIKHTGLPNTVDDCRVARIDPCAHQASVEQSKPAEMSHSIDPGGPKAAVTPTAPPATTHKLRLQPGSPLRAQSEQMSVSPIKVALG